MPDATGLELIAQELREARRRRRRSTRSSSASSAALLVAPAAVPATLEHLRGKGFGFLASVHGVDYFPEEPRLGVHYELLDMRDGRPHLGQARACRIDDAARAVA